MKIKECFEPIIAIGIVVGLIIGAITYFATAEDLKVTQLRLEQKIQFDRMSDTKRIMQEIKMENKGKSIEKWSTADQKIYKELELQLEKTQEELKIKK